MEVTEWFGRPYNREGGGKFDDIPMVGETGVQNLSGGKELAPHSDVQDYPIPPDVTVLHGVEVPPVSAGGEHPFRQSFSGLRRTRGNDEASRRSHEVATCQHARDCLRSRDSDRQSNT